MNDYSLSPFKFFHIFCDECILLLKLKKETNERFFVRGVETSPLDHTFSADLLILVWPFLKAASHSLFCRAWLCSKVKATRQSGNRPVEEPGWTTGLCVHIWPEKLIAPPPAVSSFTKWRAWFLVCKAPYSSKIGSSWFSPSSSAISFPFYVPLYHLVDPSLEGQTHLKIWLWKVL